MTHNREVKSSSLFIATIYKAVCITGKTVVKKANPLWLVFFCLKYFLPEIIDIANTITGNQFDITYPQHKMLDVSIEANTYWQNRHTLKLKTARIPVSVCSLLLAALIRFNAWSFWSLFLDKWLLIIILKAVHFRSPFHSFI